jgi:phage/plasmid-like protein (TIGR03299 family)
MAHQMGKTDKMYSVREAPWHMDQTNSVVLDSAPETRDERMRLAGHDWEVTEEPVFAGDGLEIPGFKVVRRSDTHKVFNVLKDSFGTVQNDFGHQLFEALSKDSAMDDGTGGTIRDGALCYLSARLNEPIQVKGDDSLIFPYVVCTWAHDGTASVSARSTNIRPVCWNTITWGEAAAIKAGTDYTFRHSAKVTDRITEALKIIQGARENIAKFQELADELAAISITDDQREEFVTRFIPAPATTTVLSDRVLDNLNEARQQVRTIFDSPTIPEQHRNTGYGLMQAGVEWLDHIRGYRSSDTYLKRTLLKDEPFKAKLVPLIREVAGV